MTQRHTTKQLELAQFPSGNTVETTYHRYGDETHGPTVYIQAAQHGREITGTEILRQVHNVLEKNHLSGEVLTVPVANPVTFERKRRTATHPVDSSNPNMNRVWPGDKEGTIHECMAATLWDLAKNADVIIDLHSISSVQLPHVRPIAPDKEADRLANRFGTELAIPQELPARAVEQFEAGDLRDTLTVAASAASIPALTVEIGHSRQLTQSAVQTGVEGIRAVLEDYNVLQTDKAETDDPMVIDTHHSAEVTKHAGIFVPDSEYDLNDWVAEGEILGEIINPSTFEVLQQITAEQAGIIWYIGREATVYPNEGVVGVAVPAEGSE